MGEAETALAKLSGDLQRIIFSHLSNVLDPSAAVSFSSASSELRALTRAECEQLRAGCEAAAALGHKIGRNGKSSCKDKMLVDWLDKGVYTCKELREAKTLHSFRKGLSSNDLALLGTLGSVLPALEKLVLCEDAAGPDGMQRLADKLSAGALPAMTALTISSTRLGDEGVPALAAALGRGALPRLKILGLASSDLTDAGLAAFAPTLRRLPKLETLYLSRNPLGDEGIAALISPPTSGLAKLRGLYLNGTQLSDAGCATLASALGKGAMPALEVLHLEAAAASAAAKASVRRAGLAVMD
jgi:hypothetical protein